MYDWSLDDRCAELIGPKAELVGPNDGWIEKSPAADKGISKSKSDRLMITHPQVIDRILKLVDLSYHCGFLGQLHLPLSLAGHFRFEASLGFPFVLLGKTSQFRVVMKSLPPRGWQLGKRDAGDTGRVTENHSKVGDPGNFKVPVFLSRQGSQ